mmetsp:Transcript_21099/g.29210  ORF Transcript_21099/g.29210 Transcript_21099/m.29210 type:complete len:369 (-) Transcript_21099:628-1734(-)
MEVNHVAQHVRGLVEGAELIVRGKRVLLQVVVLDDASRLKDDFLLVCQRVLAHQLHNLIQILLFLQNVSSLGSHRYKIRLISFIETFKSIDILGVRDAPIHRRKMLSLSKFFIKSPEHLHDSECGCGDRVGEVASRRRDSTHNGDGALALRAAQALHLTCALVEGGKPSTQVRRVPRICRHLCKTTTDLSKGLCPSRRGVSHHTEVVSHVSKIFCEGNSCVDGSLSGSHRHVRGVGHKSGALHDRLLRAIWHCHGEFREVHKDFSHFVTPLTAANVNNAVGVGVLGEGLGDYGLAASEGPRNGACAAQHRRKQSVQHTLACKQRVVGHKLAGDGPWLSHRPILLHCEPSLLAKELNFNNFVLDCVISI